ncbi:hypothetical protein I302_100929 [Kwoniella bestiolae CBS 10118]|uniref:Uncharacterized protein n=1 Tax=Kwoniella bestiolae CBS 10118 TaxID=1296100 RepID=A0A1B9G6F8_9TREE|nr:hypothetical protein I302_04305 [Kwoniella bestiolae CBS 10118]OCF26619.1 hypothetical protein I302_04305 [Kwoniella bestiolae CBS 10118]
MTQEIPPSSTSVPSKALQLVMENDANRTKSDTLSILSETSDSRHDAPDNTVSHTINTFTAEAKAGIPSVENIKDTLGTRNPASLDPTLNLHAYLTSGVEVKRRGCSEYYNIVPANNRLAALNYTAPTFEDNPVDSQRVVRTVHTRLRGNKNTQFEYTPSAGVGTMLSQLTEAVKTFWQEGWRATLKDEMDSLQRKGSGHGSKIRYVEQETMEKLIQGCSTDHPVFKPLDMAAYEKGNSARWEGTELVGHVIKDGTLLFHIRGEPNERSEALATVNCESLPSELNACTIDSQKKT